MKERRNQKTRCRSRLEESRRYSWIFAREYFVNGSKNKERKSDGERCNRARGLPRFRVSILESDKDENDTRDDQKQANVVKLSD